MKKYLGMLISSLFLMTVTWAYAEFDSITLEEHMTQEQILEMTDDTTRFTVPMLSPSLEYEEICFPQNCDPNIICNSVVGAKCDEGCEYMICVKGIKRPIVGKIANG